MEKTIHFRTVIEILGRPKEHVESAIKEQVEKIKKDTKYQILEAEFAEIKKQEEQDLWATFAELEVKAAKVEDLTFFCFEFMPSIIEIVEPENFQISDKDFSLFLNDLQAQLHQVDMVAKHVKLENDQLKRNMVALLKNYIVVLLSNGRKMSSEQLGKLTGVEKDKIEDYLDHLIDEGKIDLKDQLYFLKQ